jgi:hypothetical protein
MWGRKISLWTDFFAKGSNSGIKGQREVHPSLPTVSGQQDADPFTLEAAFGAGDHTDTVCDTGDRYGPAALGTEPDGTLDGTADPERLEARQMTLDALNSGWFSSRS